MNKVIRFILMIGVIATCLGTASGASAQSALPPFCQEDSLPSHDPQYPDPQITLICIPPNWNGQLVLYAHGYVAAQFDLALPAELFLPDGSLGPNVTFMLAQGFAFATTSYHKNGYAVEQARKDLNDLLNHFKKLVKPGSLQKAYIVGASEGGEIAALMIEHFPDKYAGALAMCGPIGGGGYQVQYLSDFRAVFDYYFPDVFPFGVTDVPEDAFLNYPLTDPPTGYPLAISLAIANNSAATLQLYSVTGAARDPGDPVSSSVSTAVRILFYSIFGTNDLIATAGGMPYDNQSTVYSGSLDDTALNAGVERVDSDGRARAYMRRFYQTTGELERPLVTLHNILDPAVPFHHEEIYAGLAAQAGNSALFTVNPVKPEALYGHCNFSSDEISAAFSYLVLQASAQP
jgi:pimeloyl-ACP methyl ester carboxylesterase